MLLGLVGSRRPSSILETEPFAWTTHPTLTKRSVKAPNPFSCANFRARSRTSNGSKCASGLSILQCLSTEEQPVRDLCHTNIRSVLLIKKFWDEERDRSRLGSGCISSTMLIDLLFRGWSNIPHRWRIDLKTMYACQCSFLFLVRSIVQRHSP